MSFLSSLVEHAPRKAVALSLLGAGATIAFGCSSDENVKPSETPIIKSTGGKQNDGGGGRAGGTSGTGGKSGGAGAGGAPNSGGTTGDAGGASGAGGSGGDGGPGPEAGAGGGTTDAGCQTSTGTNGCFNCPKTTDQFLHQCTGAGVQCTPFDNTARLPLLADPLPPVP